MSTLLSKTAALALELTAKLSEHLSSDTNRISKEKVVRWAIDSKLDPRRAFTAKQRRLIWRRDGGICFYCRKPAGADWQADHVLPWSMGGRTVIQNGVCACAACNNAKSDKVW